MMIGWFSNILIGCKILINFSLRWAINTVGIIAIRIKIFFQWLIVSLNFILHIIKILSILKISIYLSFLLLFHLMYILFLLLILSLFLKFLLFKPLFQVLVLNRFPHVFEFHFTQLIRLYQLFRLVIHLFSLLYCSQFILHLKIISKIFLRLVWLK